jgi:PAS domain S-box-containing protein
MLDEVESIARIGSYAVDVPAGRWVSSKGLDAIFGIDAEFERSVSGWAKLIHPDERDAMVEYFVGLIESGRPFDRAYRIVRPDNGEERWVHGRGTIRLDAAGHAVSMIGTIADITEARHAQDEVLRSQQRYAAIFEGAAEAILIAEMETQRFRWVNPAASAMFGYTPDEMLRLTIHDIHPGDALPEILKHFVSLTDGEQASLRSVPCRRKDGTPFLADLRASTAVLDGVPCNIGFFTDVTQVRQLENRDRRLALAVEQSSDSVVITDLAGVIEYVNPAFERASGYGRDEAVGQNPRILNSGQQSAATYRRMWRRLAGGKAWSGTLVNRARDGSLYIEEATIAPIHDPDGPISGYVAVKRDVTRLRAAEADLAREARERAEVAAALAVLQPGPTPEDTAADIVDGLLGLGNIDAALVLNFLDPHRAVSLAVAGPEGMPLAPGRPLPTARAAYLYERASQGPWAEAWEPRSADGRYGQAMAEIGIRAVAYAPIRNGEGLLGVVAAATCDPEYARHLIDRLPAVSEFAATASALLSGPLERGHRDVHVREHIEEILLARDFSPVFQPVVSLATRECVGFEALTRFADGTPPDRVIADAHSVGLGVELEAACAAAALDAAGDLPARAWLSVNLSPATLLHPSALPAILAAHSRPVVLEVTEHVEIADYAPLRAALNRLGPMVQLAVDDAGAGFASLRHVVELRPQFLKLDISLVRGLQRDVTRQAMVAGLRHFAGRAGCHVIAEGIESEAELAMLLELDVPFGQGFLLGRPAPPIDPCAVDAPRRRAPRRHARG